MTVWGDFNVEMANCQNQNSIRFINLLRSLNVICTIKTPTRIDSCIDNILVNSNDSVYNINSFEGHFAVHNSHIINMFTIVIGTKQRPMLKIATRLLLENKRIQTEVNLFVNHLKNTSWEMISEFKSDKITVDNLFDSFFKQYLRVIGSS